MRDAASPTLSSPVAGQCRAMATPDSMSWLLRYDAGHYKPVTFIERGVALPFTTPSLMGGRIRPGERKSAELILANPAGVEGVYILPWVALPDICSPSLHDRALWVRVTQQPHLTPRAVREATRAVAMEGHAGRAAARAAAEAMRAMRDARTLTQYFLLLELVRQGEPADTNLPPPERDDPASVERRAKAVLHRRRNEPGLAPTSAFESLAELAEVFEPIGLRKDPTRARLPRLAAELGGVMQELANWAEATDAAERAGARLLVQSAALTLRCYRVALGEAHGLLDDLWALLPRWQLAPEQVHLLAARPEWLLDGWELICGLWRGAEQAMRGAAVLDMAALVPVIPSEVGDWAGFDAPGDMESSRTGLRRWRRTVQPNQDWMSGRMLDLTARNETLRAQYA
jgi:hypothetical protein